MQPLVHAKNKLWRKRMMVGTPTLGLIRYEWAESRYNQIVPMNWELQGFSCTYNKWLHLGPIGYSIDDAYNLIVDTAIKRGVKWLLIIEDDVIVPHNLFVKMAEYMDKEDTPIVSGLYYLKASPTQPLMFRGRGNGAFTKFKVGDKVWVDGIPMGCLLVHMSILKYMHEKAPYYKTNDGTKLKRVFLTPRQQFYDPKTLGICNLMGTQDLYWCDQIINDGILDKTGWPKIGKKKYPFLVDTGIFCKHIDINTGKQYP